MPICAVKKHEKPRFCTKFAQNLHSPARVYTPKISANLTVFLLGFSAQNLHKCPGGDTGFKQPDGDGSSGDKELDKPRKTGKIKRKQRGKIKVSDGDMATIVENLKLRKPPVGTVQHASGASHNYTVYVESEDYFVVINKERLP